MSRPDAVPCRELVLYRIKADAGEQLPVIRAAMAREMATLAGFLRLESLTAADDTLQRMDCVYWQSVDAARAGFAQWKTLPSAERFMACVDSVDFTGHFLEQA